MGGKNMNITILTGRFGMGHVKCAQAVEEIIKSNNPNENVSVIDFIDYCFPTINEAIYKSFEMVVFKMSLAYNALAKATDKNSIIPFKSVFMKKIDQMMDEYKPDLVIACLPLCAEYFSEYKRVNNESTPLYVYITDISVHKDWVSDQVDAYFVGDEETRHSLVKRGVSSDIIHTTGIPVSESFFTVMPEKDFNKTQVLIMGGGLGIIPGKDVTLSALNKSKDVNVTIVCGKNEKLLNHVKKHYKNINAIGYCNDIPSLMASSDVIITKPGGITTFEAIKSETPLYIIEPSLEQELENARFIETKQLGKIVYTKEEFSSDDLLRFVNDKKLIDSIKRNMRKVSSYFESSDPVRLYLEAA